MCCGVHLCALFGLCGRTVLNVERFLSGRRGLHLPMRYYYMFSVGINRPVWVLIMFWNLELLLGKMLFWVELTFTSEGNLICCFSFSSWWGNFYRIGCSSPSCISCMLGKWMHSMEMYDQHNLSHNQTC